MRVYIVLCHDCYGTKVLEAYSIRRKAEEYVEKLNLFAHNEKYEIIEKFCR